MPLLEHRPQHHLGALNLALHLLAPVRIGWATVAGHDLSELLPQRIERRSGG